MKIFISHSHKNRDAAKALVDFLLSGLALEDKDIRCTSVPGHQLRFGKSIAELLKADINIAPAVIALISSESRDSDWVLFELGAAWGLERNIFPILGPGLKIRDLPGPLVNLPCIEVEADDTSNRMADLLQQIGEDLDTASRSGGKVQANLDAFLTCYKSRPATDVRNNGVSKSPETEEQVILVIIWKLDEAEYDQRGYSLETIAQRSEIVIPKCEHILNTLVKKNLVERKKYIGGITGNRYTLKDDGHKQLLQTGLVE